MMKKRILSLAVMAGMVGAASTALAQTEMYVNSRGLGEVLVYPFYSAANGNDTYVHVINTADNAKAVKVRILESQNSREVLDFNLYLSPQDVWAAVITADADSGGAFIRTVDNSCTVPMLGTGGVGAYAGTVTVDGDRTIRDQPFVPYAYDIAGELDRAIGRTLEGHIEIIEMGVLDPTHVPDFEAAVTHNPAGVPANCTGLTQAFSVGAPAPFGGLWIADAADGFLSWDTAEDAVTLAPVVLPVGYTADAGGLYGFGVVINVAEGTASSYDAISVDNFVLAGDPPLHTNSGDLLPNLGSGQLDIAVIGEAAITTHTFTPGVGDPAGSYNAFSALLTATDLANDFVIDPDINASTDWVITFPTKNAYVDFAGGNVSTDPALAPFTNRWVPAASAACEPIGVELWDREEAVVVTTTGPIFSPAPPGVAATEFQLCKEVNVISFGEDSAINASSRVLHGLEPDYTEGWSAVSFFEGFDLIALNNKGGVGNHPEARLLIDDGANEFVGLPAVGFAVFGYQNGELESGVLANYGATSVHKSALIIQ